MTYKNTPKVFQIQKKAGMTKGDKPEAAGVRCFVCILRSKERQRQLEISFGQQYILVDV